jgi:nicotinamide-nucleotide amidase
VIVELIAVGTELLLGQIINSNAAAIGTRLADEGFDAHYQVTVGDNLARLVATIRTALQRSDAVILTGGIGPTQDDLTKDALCELTGATMRRDEEHADKIRARVAAIGGPPPTSALRMADYPEGSEPLPNRNGAALGVALKHNGKFVFAVPGVPREMTVMVDEQVMPRLRAAIDAPTVLRSRVIKTWGHGEAHISDVLGDLYETTNPSIAFLIDETEVRIRISAKSDDEEQAFALIAPVQAEIERRLDGYIFGYDDDTGIGVLGRRLSDRGWTVGVEEVATAGLLASRLAPAPGMPFAGGITRPVAATTSPLEVARALRASLGADVAVAIGTAGTDEESTRAAMVVPLAVVTPEGEIEHTLRVLGDGERARTHAASSAVHMARLAVEGRWQAGAKP